MQRQERIYDRTQSVRAALAFDTSPRTPPPSTPDRTYTWRRQVAVAAYTWQVVKEMGRRGYVWCTRTMSSCFVAIDHHYIRCFNSQFSSTSQQQRRRITPVLALLLLLVAATVVRFVVSIPYQYYNLHYVRPHKPTDDTIQAHILVDVAPGQKAKPPPHLRGDTFYIEPWTGQCKNTVHGLVYATDARGITCKRRSLMPTGCCGDDVRFSCSTCDVEAPHCCLAYERCVSCCMGPTNTALVHAFLAHADPKHPVYGQPPSDLTLFGFCTFRCRTSSAGVQHQNSYRSAKKHCYGVHRPLKELDVVNSDESALHNATTSPPRHDELREQIQVATTTPPVLEYDPFYIGKS
ncbi:hypothetical protein H257_06162 [Aphanomyces astaci]|uniref:SREBP regulating gene protein n=1 Tax=Aphanomyces astaci TaxID=112090 RepID=W4GNS0_APHAT|nr:hypothetical protein H257_06162 [Aphanomyces astaci]ETV80639.1 hypothetical protein H257_06162 [Aphanomyces astaci]|eukprot:XP_009829586.1 hypothetical protein H257_06162 [Aphanomyces astaci]